ncbi:MAG: hypothetical protein R3B48_09035 [Kofleriaceae bacterium]
MKQTPNIDLDLMLHLDGELDASEEGAVAARLEERGVRAKAEAMRELGELVRGHIELVTDDAEPRLATMWAEVAKRLDNEDGVAPPARAARASDEGGLWRALSGWIERYRGHLLSGALSAGVVAILLRPAAPGSEDRHVEGTTAVPATFVSAPPEIESLDVPNGTGSVLTIEDEDGAAAIVWVTPDDVEDI